MHSVLGLATRETRYAHTVAKPKFQNPAAKVRSSPTCSLCASSATIRAFAGNGWDWWVCNRCDLFFVHPPPQGHRRCELVSASKPEIALLESHERYRDEVRYYRAHFHRIAQECRGARSLLDAGCGTGHLLERFSRDAGLYCLGIEPDPLTARFARCVAGCQVVETQFEKFKSRRQFDVVTMINVFPHFRSPGAALQSLRSVLAPRGKAILCTDELRRVGLGWNRLHRGMPDGFQFLGPGTLDFACATYGFRVISRLRIKQPNRLLPGALIGPRRLYATALGRRFTSFIVLEAVPGTEEVLPGYPYAARGVYQQTEANVAFAANTK
jgi:SAM-dependent methyltransferase